MEAGRGARLARGKIAAEGGRGHLERAQVADLVGLERPRQARCVLALDPVARVEDPVGPLPVVREEDQPLRVAVESSDGIEAAGSVADVARDELDELARKGVTDAQQRPRVPGGRA